MKKILTDAAAVGQAAGRALNWRCADAHPDWAYYEARSGAACCGRAAPSSRRRRRPSRTACSSRLPPTGARTLDSRTAFYYGYTLDSPGMIMRIPGVGSQYLMGFLDADGDALRRREDLQGDAAQGHPGARPSGRFTLYDNQTRSMLQTPQKYPRAGSQSYPSPAAEAAADGTTTVWFAPEQPEGVARGNWIQTDPEQGLVHAPAPLQPAAEPFFDKAGGRARSSRPVRRRAARPGRRPVRPCGRLAARSADRRVRPVLQASAGRCGSLPLATRAESG